MALHNNQDQVGHGDPHPSNDQQRHVVYGTCVSVDDPLQSGRIQVEILGEQMNIKNLPWVQCEYNNEAQIRGIGSFPPKYQVGTKLVLERHGDTITVRSSIANTLKDQKKDINAVAASSGPKQLQVRVSKIIGCLGSSAFQRHISAGLPGSIWKWSGKEIAKKVNETVINQAAHVGDAMQSCLDNSCTPKHLKNIFGQLKFETLNKPFSMGQFPFDAVNNTAKSALKTLGKNGNLIDKALEMTQSMQSFAEKGGVVKPMDIIGGVQNFKSAIASVSSLMSSLSSQMGVEKEKDSLDEFLYQLYFEETGLQALDERGKETKEFKVWRKNYLARTEEVIS